MFELPKKDLKVELTKTILKIYAEFEITEKGLIPITHKSWLDYPKEKKEQQKEETLDAYVEGEEEI